ncbi:MAG: Re/Si-specific NAD(P)(+) transhydrogenase subunit alpha [Actinobacteria bacterium]|uniref:proton-translocating NAD(P)(+) transhydrogenase n=2 Tax=freshwater metagenome TaxID=449393 RepID=A0A6J6Z7Q0_9ZZZZ|nr:Re/Si-specific NAD(P)(+) transhydrogenase subunit alpha [Actinomycetota bacterium]MSW21873.1 Re/Si-specific NAD(P)(+) transhydrogenase subunit alpha [Actinomycetota bacterium]MSX03684.1 Re/Si-specific NAD(P)(+) transhydrogenase subunit alpha [Actinomycetota bacterium]MSX84023.1 Re/Si-specific NAD(P)(+) transhydrogenase subunit alpha [Actinomycetota bacterium]MSY96210.1 Re/Si-specific NAD(P)(+) transhydrogenase subunit alpha [Actinomycetota bacterium]
MRIAVAKEIRSGEARVALVPDIISKLTKAGLEVVIESGAGVASGFPDSQFTAAGATVKSGNVISDADVIASVTALTPDQMKSLKKGALTISFLSPTTSVDSIDAAASAGVTAISLELVPRISRAQSMDALTSQALCAGYRASLVAAELSPRFFPLLMTAAGTVTPAQVVVLGAGVAGLQAIATAKRLGAVVSAYDVRPSSADEVKSMGAKFITLELEALEGAGGYAREMTEERAAKQRELLTPYLAAADVLITTAAVPGRPAPRLVTSAMVSAMKSGAVIVDLAAETGGNVEGSKPGETITTSNGVVIWGGKDVPSQLPYHASMLFSRNVVNLLLLMTKSVDGKPTGDVIPDFSDEIIDSATLTHGGSRRTPEGKK